VSERGLADRVEAITKVVEGGNNAIHAYNKYQVADLLEKLDFEDLTPEELVTIAMALATAYGRKLSAEPPGPPLRLVPEGWHGCASAEYLCG
jgi:DNA-binding transcriptional regulator PaaX